MNQAIKDALLEELKKRQLKEEQYKELPKFTFTEHCFESQQNFFRAEGNRFRTAVCSRRAGKTVGIAADAIDTCMNELGVTCLYITLTQQNARNIIWGDLEKILEEYKIECKVDNTRLTIKFPNKSRLVIAGAKDRQEIEKYRGWKLRKCYIDECQSFRPYIKELIDDIIVPALRDLRGELFLTGTPGPIPAGPFYEYSHSDFWENHKWTAFDNPHMHDPNNGIDLDITLAEERQMKGIDENDPGYLRETYGLWVEDKDSLVFKFNSKINIYTKAPNISDMTIVFGIDIGYNDADAIAVIGYNDQEKKVYLIEEKVTRKQNISSLVDQINELRNIYKPVKMVMDAGALGKKIQEELISRHQLNIEAAEKSRKVEFIELLNDDLKTGKFQAFEGSVFEEDCMLVQWDRESRMKNPERPKVSDVYHSDITDAVLYAWRECRHYLSERTENVTYEKHVDAYMDKMEQEEAEKVQFRKDNDDWEMWEAFEDDLNDPGDDFF